MGGTTGSGAEQIKRVVVLGAGTMGHGIAHIMAFSGRAVTLCDIQSEVVERGLAHIRGNLDKGVARGKITDEARQATLANLSGSSRPAEALRQADLLIEAVPEDAELKRKVLADAAAHMKPEALVASNTSSLPLSRLAPVVPGPARFLGLHFFNPPHIMRLVEIVVGKATSPATVSTADALVVSLGKQGIVVSDSPGFATSRLGVTLGLEAMRMLEEGVASAADIDRAMELGYNHPMGPLKLTDLVGLDVRLGICETLARELDQVRFAAPAILRRKVEAGKLGKKTGEGFYRWTADGPEAID